jgi:hypothetical protein
MLFDLRGRGRRRTVQVIYATLAVLMGGGLVLFGIGGATSGGLVDAFNSNGGSSVSELNSDQLEAAEAKVRANRDSARAWGDLARVRVARARQIGFDQNQGAFTEEGKAELREADRAWQMAVKLAKKPDPNVAALMIGVYGEGALNEPKEAVRAQEYVLDARDKVTSEQYASYAVLAYQAGQIPKGDLAAKRSVALAPRAQRKNLKQQLEQVK